MTTRIRQPVLIRTGLMLVLTGLLITGCDKPRAMGDPNQILVVTPTPVWNELETDIKTALEPSTFTVRDERVFDVAHADPSEQAWADLQVMRQILVIGSPEDPVVAEALERSDGETPTPPTIFQVRNVWAQDQLVTVSLVPPGSAPAAVQTLLPEIGEIYLRQFEEYAHARMFVTRPDEELTDSLRREAGFALTVPQVYRYSQVEPGLFVFRNDQPDPSRLIRNINVHSRPAAEVELTPEAARAWREEIATRTTTPPQVTEDALTETKTVEVPGGTALQIQGVWSNPPGEWPAAGVFITRLVPCGERTFLLDAWLYAPGIDKYEYMYQLHTILGSFECS